jgi:hypothetical protein
VRKISSSVIAMAPVVARMQPETRAIRKPLFRSQPRIAFPLASHRSPSALDRK